MIEINLFDLALNFAKSGSPIRSVDITLKLRRDTEGVAPSDELAFALDLCKLKEFKRIAMRADKTDNSFSAPIYLASAVINSR